MSQAIRFRTPRRVLDLVVALPAALVSFPLVVLLVAVASATSRAPGIYRQTRIGQGGKRFTIYKIRSMKRSAGGSTVTTASDARITSFGAGLRRFKLDELPQLWNVVAGQMGLVGPRPDVPGYADTLVGEQFEILELRPGITGPASLVFRDEEQLLLESGDPETFNDTVLWPEKVAINLAYARHATLADDIRLIVMTLRPDPARLLAMLRRWNAGLADLEIAGRLLDSSS